MIRNLKKAFISQFIIPIKKTVTNKDVLIKNLNKIKIKIKSGFSRDDTNFNLKNDNNQFLERIVNQDKVLPTQEIETNINLPKEKILKNIKTVKSSPEDSKFLRKKLNRKLTRIKRKIKRYKVSQVNKYDINKVNKESAMINHNDNRLDELNKKIKDLQSELGNLQENSSSDKTSLDAIKIQKRYKKKIKKLRSKINKLNKENEVKNNVVNLRKDPVVELKEQQIANTNSQDKIRIKELEELLENYKRENKDLLNKSENHNNFQKTASEYEYKIQSLEDKIKHYQEENVRLANKISSQEKRIEIMNNQIQNFDNLKNKLYEQVNLLGDTLLENDNVEKIFDDRNPVVENNLQNDKILKISNSDDLIITNENQKNHSVKNIDKKDLNSSFLDQEISKIFSE